MINVGALIEPWHCCAPYIPIVLERRRDECMYWKWLNHIPSILPEQPMAAILGNSNVFIESGSVLNLTCVVKHAISKPAFIIWRHGTKVSLFCAITFTLSLLCNPHTQKGLK